MATRFGKQGSLDRSVHQSECVKLEDNLLLVSLGQHPEFRALIKFDVNWLFEKERSDDFTEGLKNWSVQKYIKGVKGHCAYNRKPGAIVIKHPDKTGKNVMLLKTEKDSSLINQNSGALFNFSSGTKGEINFRIQFRKDFEGLNINLSDRWFNPTDTVAKYYAMHSLYIPKNLIINNLELKPNKWYNIKLKWTGANDENNGNCKFYIDNKMVDQIPLNNKTVNGISYIHFILPFENENKGILVESISAEVR